MEVRSQAKVPRLTVLAQNRRSAAIKLQQLRDQHDRDLRPHAVIEEFGNCSGAGAMEMVEPAKKVFPIERESAVLESCVERRHLLSRFVNGDARPKQIWIKDNASIRESKLSVLEPFAVWLTLLGLFAVGEVGAQSGSQPFVMLEVSETGAEFACSGLPYQRGGNCIETVIKLRCADAKSA
jgi:hypothetical protein